jgi:hypothetical protein
MYRHGNQRTDLTFLTTLQHEYLISPLTTGSVLYFYFISVLVLPFDELPFSSSALGP